MKTHNQKLKELRAASAAQKAERETIFAQIDEAIATQRPMVAFSVLEKDHGPMLKRLRKIAAKAVKGEKVSIAERDLRTLPRALRERMEPNVNWSHVAQNAFAKVVGARSRISGEFHSWRATLTIRYDPSILSAEQIVNLFNAAGFAVGIGVEINPPKNYGSSKRQ